MHLKQNLTCAMHLKECIRSRREYRQRAIPSSVRIREICRCNTISFASKLYKSLVTSILLYESKTWILLADSKNRRKDPGFRNQGHEKYSPYLLLGVGCGAKSTSLWIHRNLFRRLSRDGNLHGSGMSHATTASTKPSFRYLRGLETPLSAEEMLDGQHQRVDIPAHTRAAHKGLLQKRLEEDFC